jgi:hypothetical protein
METVPLIFMLITELTITSITVYFFVRVLKNKNPND